MTSEPNGSTKHNDQDPEGEFVESTQVGRRQFVGAMGAGLGMFASTGMLLTPVELFARGNVQGSGRSRAEMVVPGFPTHGVNNYLGFAINDYSAITNHPLVTDERPYFEVGLFNPDGPREDLPSLNSNPDRILGTTSDMATKVLPPGIYSPDDFIFNRPFSELGTLFFGSQNIFDRQRLVSAEECDPHVFGKSFCMRSGAIADPTLRQWNRVRPRMIIREVDGGVRRVTLQIREALPHALYTTWFVGIINNFTERVQLVASPFGGLPNVIVTDKNGHAQADFEINFDPMAEVGQGPGKGGSLYISVFWHPDGAAYGGSPTLDFINDSEESVSGQPVGVLGANHMFFPLQGEPILTERDIL